MPIDEKKLFQKLKDKDREINELKQLLAEAEHEIKELNDFHGFQRPRPSILESAWLNKLIKRTAFLLMVAVIIFIGIYPWLFKDKILGGKDNGQPAAVDKTDSPSDSPAAVVDQPSANQPATTTPASPPESEQAAAGQNVSKPSQLLIVKSDLGWLNVRTEPSVETGKIIKKINSDEEVEWLEKTDNNWYKVKLDQQGHTGYVSGEYVEVK